jgi:hypothetical protein
MYEQNREHRLTSWFTETPFVENRTWADAAPAIVADANRPMRR